MRTLLLVCVITGVGCGGSAPAVFPGAADVDKAQAEWCAALAEASGAAATWEHMGACKSAKSAASAAYLRGITKCFAERVKDLGKEAPDHPAIVAECRDEVLVHLPDDSVTGKEVIDARCARMQRCEQVPDAECHAAVGKLEAAQRAMFTVTYNGGALHEVSECLASSSCSDDEEKARDACYQNATERLVWYPH